jgi:transcriptional regulator with XRE-family HTH domain
MNQMIKLRNRVEAERNSRGLSLRKLGLETGISFSTLARTRNGLGEYSPETARRLRIWLDGDGGETIALNIQRQAEDLGRLAARAFAQEFIAIVKGNTDAKR